jgi:hypothetical protein
VELKGVSCVSGQLGRYSDGLRGSIPSRSKIFPVFHIVQTSSRAHPAFYSIGAGSSTWGQSGRRVKLTTYYNLAQESRMVELNLHSLTRFQGVVLKGMAGQILSCHYALTLITCYNNYKISKLILISAMMQVCHPWIISVSEIGHGNSWSVCDNNVICCTCQRKRTFGFRKWRKNFLTIWIIISFSKKRLCPREFTRLNFGSLRINMNMRIVWSNGQI